MRFPLTSNIMMAGNPFLTDEYPDQYGKYLECSPGRWEDGNCFPRVREWDYTEEFVVCGYILPKKSCGLPGREAKELSGVSLILGKFRDGGVVFKGHVTSGVDHKAILRLKEGKCPFRIYVEGSGKVVWCVPDQVCIIEYVSWTRKPLHNAMFRGFRDEIYGWEVLNTD